jgi:hypothetical protein
MTKVLFDGVLRDATPEEIIQFDIDEQNAVNVKLAYIRHQRDIKLNNSDWTQGNDSPLTAEKKSEWATYRQALRDITEQSDPFNIVWPTIPN